MSKKLPDLTGEHFGRWTVIEYAGAEDAVAYEWGQRANSFEWTMEWLQQPAEGE